MGKLHAAARDGHADAAMKMVEAGCDVNEMDNFMCTPLHYASRRGLTTLVQRLLEANGDPRKANDKGQTALYQAVVGGHTDIVRSLVAAGATTDEKTSSGFGALHFAARAGNIDIVQILIGAGADISIMNKQGYSPRKLAKQNGHAEIADILDRLESTAAYEEANNVVRRVSTAGERVQRISHACIDGEIDEETALMLELEAIEVKPVVANGLPSHKTATAKADSTQGNVSRASSVHNSPEKQHGSSKGSKGNKSNVLASELDQLSQQRRNKEAPKLPVRSYTTRDATPAAYSKVIKTSKSFREGSASSEPVYDTELPSFIKKSKDDHTSSTTKNAQANISGDRSPRIVHNDTSTGELEMDAEMTMFLQELGLLERCGKLLNEAGIITPDDFLLFEQNELVNTFKFKVGYVRKIFHKLKKS